MRHSQICYLRATLSNLSALSNLKLPQLRRILLATGLSTTGTKTELLGRLEPYLPEAAAAAAAKDVTQSTASAREDREETPRRKRGKKRMEAKNEKDAVHPHYDANARNKTVGMEQKYTKDLTKNKAANTAPTMKKERILSIDMGIQNLAFCVADVETGGSADRMHVVAWRRVSPTSFLPSVAQSQTPQPASSSVRLPSSVFTSQNLALAAQSLLTRTFLPYAPSTILIERQRFRTGGVAAVQEWTLRVNTLEAALWGVLAALREGRDFDASGSSGVRGDPIAEKDSIDDGVDGQSSKVGVISSEIAPSGVEIARKMPPVEKDPSVFAVSPARVVGYWTAVLAGCDNGAQSSEGSVANGNAGKKTKKGKRRQSSIVKSVRDEYDSMEESGSEDSVNDGSQLNNNSVSAEELEPASSRVSQTQAQPRKDPLKLNDKRAKVMLVKRWLVAGSTDPVANPGPGPGPDPDPNSNPYSNFKRSSRLIPSLGLHLTFSPDAQDARDAILGHGERRKRGARARRKSSHAGADADAGVDAGAGIETDVDDGADADASGLARISSSPPSPSTPVSTSAGAAGKVDDLADCILQAAAWARWRGNRQVLRRGGWRSLVEGRVG